jgi:chromosome partitioning protein
VSKPSPSAPSASPRSATGAGRPARNKSERLIERSPAPPASAGTARVVAIANQKGGVGKSTTAVSLGAALAEDGFRVLVVDLDPQGNASTGMGIRHDARGVTVYDVVVAEAAIENAIVPTAVKGLDAVPSTIDLAGAEIELVSQFSRENRLKKALAPVAGDRYDFIFLDCPPSLGLLTINALTAAEELIVPIQCEYYALEGLGQLLRNVNLVQQNINQELRLTGIVMTMFDPRTKLSEQVVDEVRRFFGEVVYDAIIPRTVRLSEAPGFGQPITVYDPRSKGADSYRSLAKEVAGRPRPDAPMPVFDELPTVVISKPTTDETGPVQVPAAAGDPDADESPEEEPPATRDETPVPQPEPEAPTPATDAGPEQPAPENGPPAKAEALAEPAPGTDALPAPPAPDVAHAEEDLWDNAARTERKVRPPRAAVAPGKLPERRVVVIAEDSEIDIEAAKEPLVQVPNGRVTTEEERDAADIGGTLQDEREGPKRRWRLFRKGGG